MSSSFIIIITRLAFNNVMPKDWYFVFNNNNNNVSFYYLSDTDLKDPLFTGFDMIFDINTNDYDYIISYWRTPNL